LNVSGTATVHCKVFVVEDDSDVRESLSTLLRTHEYRVASAVHGKDALSQLSAGYTPDVILLDLDMPVMDGFQVLAELRKNPIWMGVRIVIVSALRDDRIWALSAHDYVTKPIDVTTLLGSIAAQCAEAHRDRSIDGSARPAAPPGETSPRRGASK
jgi:CheY-like chemotaxis protein